MALKEENAQLRKQLADAFATITVAREFAMKQREQIQSLKARLLDTSDQLEKSRSKKERQLEYLRERNVSGADRAARTN